MKSVASSTGLTSINSIRSLEVPAIDRSQIRNPGLWCSRNFFRFKLARLIASGYCN